jgi:hypothetical protein
MHLEEKLFQQHSAGWTGIDIYAALAHVSSNQICLMLISTLGRCSNTYRFIVIWTLRSDSAHCHYGSVLLKASISRQNKLYDLLSTCKIDFKYDQ